MMKSLCLTAILLSFVAILSCTPCLRKETTINSSVIPTVEIPVLPTHTTPSSSTTTIIKDKVFKGMGWKFSTPPNWSLLEINEPGIEALVVGENNRELILLAKDTCQADHATCINSSVKSLKDSGAQVYPPIEVMINNHNFWFFKSIIDTIQISAWIYIFQDKVFIFSCGGPITSNVEITCDQIIKTLNIE